MFYKVYMHIFPNGKKYIGITTLDLERRWANGKNYEKQMVYNAIKKYGWGNIKHELLFENLTKEQAEKKEIELISLYKTSDRNFGYNIELGGNSYGKKSEETKQKISKKLKGRVFTEEAKKKMSASAKKKKLTQQHKNNIGKSLSKEKCHWFGTKRTKQEKERIMDYFAKRILCVETNKEYKTYLQIQKETGINRLGVSRCIQGTQNTAGGCHWKIIE